MGLRLLQCVAVCCSVLQCITSSTYVLDMTRHGSEIVAVCCCVLQCVAVHYIIVYVYVYLTYFVLNVHNTYVIINIYTYSYKYHRCIHVTCMYKHIKTILYVLHVILTNIPSSYMYIYIKKLHILRPYRFLRFLFIYIYTYTPSSKKKKISGISHVYM